MYVKLSPGDMNPGLCPQHPTSIYIRGVTTELRVHGGVLIINAWIQITINTWNRGIICVKSLSHLCRM